MAEATFDVNVYTPAGLVLNDQTSSITLPTANGEIGVLPAHTSYTGILGTGVVEFKSASSGNTIRLVISEGFCSFVDNRLEILADAVDTKEKVDSGSYDLKRHELESKLVDTDTTSLDWKAAKVALERIAALDQLLGKGPGSRVH